MNNRYVIFLTVNKVSVRGVLGPFEYLQQTVYLALHRAHIFQLAKKLLKNTYMLNHRNNFTHTLLSLCNI